MGWIASPTLIAAQSSAEWQVRGVVTGTNMFARSMGSAVGIAVFGAIANAALIGAAGAGGHGSISLDGVDPLVLFDALHRVFLGSAVIAVAMLIGVALMPRKPGEHQLVPRARLAVGEDRQRDTAEWPGETDPPDALPDPCVVVLAGAAGSGKSTWAATSLHPVRDRLHRRPAGGGRHRTGRSRRVHRRLRRRRSGHRRPAAPGSDDGGRHPRPGSGPTPELQRPGPGRRAACGARDRDTPARSVAYGTPSATAPYRPTSSPLSCARSVRSPREAEARGLGPSPRAHRAHPAGRPAPAALPLPMLT